MLGSLLGPVSAQQPITVRGTIDRIDGPAFVLKTRYGAEVRFKIGENPEFFVARKVLTSELKTGEFVVAVTRPEADGPEKAVELQILPEALQAAMRDDLQKSQPRNYCNGTIAAISDGQDGTIVSIVTNGTTKKILVASQTPTVVFDPGQADDLKPGVPIFATHAKKQPEGLLATSLVLYGQNGTAPRL